MRTLGSTNHTPVATLLWRLVTWPARVAQARRDFAMLASLGDRELRDIGLSRQDLRDATALPLSENATHVLARRAGERAELARARRSERGQTTANSERDVPPAAQVRRLVRV